MVNLYLFNHANSTQTSHTELSKADSEHSDSVFWQESSLIYVCINKQDGLLKPTSVEIFALQPGANQNQSVRFKFQIQGQNIRRLARQGDNLIAFSTRDYYVLDSNLVLKQDKRPYAADFIEGKFSNIGDSYEEGELMLLFAGIYFIRLDTSGEELKKRCLVQVSSMIQFKESVY